MKDMTYEEALKLLNDMQFKDEYQGKDEYTDMLLACKQALDKQIPKSPILDIIYPSGIKSYKCPVCEKGCLVRTDLYYPKFCSNCGQALDWSGIE